MWVWLPGLFWDYRTELAGLPPRFLGWVADHWGIPFTLQIVFLFPLFAFLTFLFIPYPSPLPEDSRKPPRIQ